MSAQRRRRDWLIVLFVAGLLLFNYPLLGLVNIATLLLGVPGLYFYLFAVWLLLIAATAVVLWYYRAATSDKAAE